MAKVDVFRGKIVEFRGSWMSGLAEIRMDTGSVLCENGATVRALEECFGNVITDGHCVDQEAIRGKEIYYSTDFMGVLEAFTPVDEASVELEKMYRNTMRWQRKGR